MDLCHFGSSHYNLKMLYDTSYQDSICKYCRQCNQDRFKVDIQCQRQFYGMGSILTQRNQSPTFLPLAQRINQRPAKETAGREKKGISSGKLKFSVEAILGNDTTDDYNSKDFHQMQDTELQIPFSNDIRSHKTADRQQPLTTKRAVFSDYQRRQLEQEFLAHKYINKQERKHLSSRLCLTESQIRIWFQNRRMKWRNWQEREIMRRKRHAGLD